VCNLPLQLHQAAHHPNRAAFLHHKALVLSLLALTTWFHGMTNPSLLHPHQVRLQIQQYQVTAWYLGTNLLQAHHKAFHHRALQLLHRQILCSLGTSPAQAHRAYHHQAHQSQHLQIRSFLGNNRLQARLIKAFHHQLYQLHQTRCSLGHQLQVQHMKVCQYQVRQFHLHQIHCYLGLNQVHRMRVTPARLLSAKAVMNQAIGGILLHHMVVHGINGTMNGGLK